MVLVLKKTIKVVVVDEHGIKIKYNQLENNGLRLLPLEKVIQLEKNKEYCVVILCKLLKNIYQK